MSITALSPVAGKEPIKARLLSGVRGNVRVRSSPTNKQQTRFTFGLSGSRASSTFQVSTRYVRRSTAATPSATSSSPTTLSALPCISSTTPIATPSLRFHATAWSIPHPDKVDRGGEDASFIASNGKALGVFDGVGSWQDIGVDPGLYARSLATESNACFVATQSVNPVQLLQHAFVNSSSIQGSSTACVVTLDDAGILRATTVGDSVFFVVREGRILFRQVELQHAFNFPFQLGTGSTDTPDCGARVTLELREGDVVVLCTDGVTDNLFDEQMLSIVQSGGNEAEMAQRLAQAASRRANSPTQDTPFSKAVRELGHDYSGGKLDDITVVVGFVVNSNPSNGIARL